VVASMVNPMWRYQDLLNPARYEVEQKLRGWGCLCILAPADSPRATVSPPQGAERRL
jgi:hypothetical protein